MRALALTALVFACLTAKAGADTLTDFEAARVAYEEQRYDEAATRLERLVAETAGDAVSAAIVLESRKYLAASYLFLGRPVDARQQFVLLLRQEPEYELDPVRFPRDVVDTFEAARRQMDEEREEDARRAREAALEAERQRLEAERLAGLGTTEAVVVENSRALALLPFGVGQFRNGNRRLGRFFAVSEALLAVSVLTTYLTDFALSNQRNPSDIERYNRLNDRVAAANWISVGALGAVALAGIIEAQVRFRARIETTRPRLRGTTSPSPSPAPEARIGVGLGRLDLRIDF